MLRLNEAAHVMVRLSMVREAIRNLEAVYIAEFIMELEEDGSSLPLLIIEHISLRLRMIPHQFQRFLSLLDVINLFQVHVHEAEGVETRSNSIVANTVHGDIQQLTNQVIAVSSNDRVFILARDVIALIIFRLQIAKRSRGSSICKPILCFCIFQGSSTHCFLKPSFLQSVYSKHFVNRQLLESGRICVVFATKALIVGT